jgi:hypothetical protein
MSRLIQTNNAKLAPSIRGNKTHNNKGITICSIYIELFEPSSERHSIHDVVFKSRHTKSHIRSWLGYENIYESIDKFHSIFGTDCCDFFYGTMNAPWDGIGDIGNCQIDFSRPENMSINSELPRLPHDEKIHLYMNCFGDYRKKYNQSVKGEVCL